MKWLEKFDNLIGARQGSNDTEVNSATLEALQAKGLTPEEAYTELFHTHRVRTYWVTPGTRDVRTVKIPCDSLTSALRGSGMFRIGSLNNGATLTQVDIEVLNPINKHYDLLQRR